MQFLERGTWKIFKDYKLLSQFATGSWNIWFSINLLDFNTNFTRNHVSSNLCCYLQVVPCHLRLRARFHIRFKRHARRVGQVRHFSMKICVLKTRAKPVTKTFHENFTVNFPESAPLPSLERSGRFRSTNRFLVCCKFQDSYVLVWKPKSARSDLFIFPT